MSGVLDGSGILITGGTGSLGKALVHAALGGQYGCPERVVVFSRDEAKQHDMRLHFANRRNATHDLHYQDHAKRLQFRIGDVRNRSDLAHALDGIDTVVHAAALKQVPSCEYFPEQAIATNCLGASNLIDVIRTTPNRVHTVVGLSTDKACEPTNVMGMTKALQERLFISANADSSKTRFVSVRYGNILASRGSVIPMFLEQIRQRKPLTLTSVEMTRFLMRLEDAVATIMEALRAARPGEIVVKSAASILVADIARFLLRDRDLPTEVIGVRPGEKIHETLITRDEALRSAKTGGFVFLSPFLPQLGQTRLLEEGLEQVSGPLTSNHNVLDYGATASLLTEWNVEGVRMS